jgi:hypothetical protein
VALTLPTSTDLQSYIAGPSDDKAIQQAMDLFVMATGLSATSSALEDRIVNSAVLEMAWALQERHLEKEEEFSGASSERIGSYSYTKAVRAIGSGQKTGVSAFDIAVDYFLMQALSGGDGSVSSEHVFAEGYYHGSGILVTHEDASYTFEASEDVLAGPPPVYIYDDVEYEDLPAGTTITLSKVNGVWPGVPTDNADTIIIWKGEEPSPPVVQTRVLGQPGMLDNVDIRMIV